MQFFNINDYKKWEITSNKKHKAIYYKGLGTSEAKESKEYFDDYTNKLLTYVVEQQKDRENIKLCFDKTLSDDRKLWLQKYNPDITLDISLTKNITLSQFANKELIHYSNQST